MQKEDISSYHDIVHLVDRFYEYVLNDALLKPVFEKFMSHQLELHKDHIYNFWAFLLLNDRTYGRNVMAPHLKLVVDELHFLRWLYYFRRTLYENFEGPIALDALKRAEVIAFSMREKLLNKSKLRIM